MERIHKKEGIEEIIGGLAVPTSAQLRNIDEAIAQAPSIGHFASLASESSIDLVIRSWCWALMLASAGRERDILAGAYAFAPEFDRQAQALVRSIQALRDYEAPEYIPSDLTDLLWSLLLWRFEEEDTLMPIGDTWVKSLVMETLVHCIAEDPETFTLAVPMLKGKDTAEAWRERLARPSMPSWMVTAIVQTIFISEQDFPQEFCPHSGLLRSNPTTSVAGWLASLSSVQEELLPLRSAVCKGLWDLGQENALVGFCYFKPKGLMEALVYESPAFCLQVLKRLFDTGYTETPSARLFGVKSPYGLNLDLLKQAKSIAVQAGDESLIAKLDAALIERDQDRGKIERMQDQSYQAKHAQLRPDERERVTAFLEVQRKLAGRELPDTLKETTVTA